YAAGAAVASGDAPAAARVGCSFLRRLLAEDSSPSTMARDEGLEEEEDCVGMRRTPSTVVAIAGTVPVPVAAMMAGSDCCSSHRMVSPSDLCPSSRVSWKILAAHAAGMRIRRPRPSTLVCRSRFRGGGLPRTTAIPPKYSTGSGLGTMNPCMGIAPIAIPAAAAAVAAPTTCCCRAASPSSALSCACASMARIETRESGRGQRERLDCALVIARRARLVPLLPACERGGGGARLGRFTWLAACASGERES
uniref:Uncharacterized protein n=2 Tax=Setaria italica TaxID=4555 RepID=A0A0Q3SX28_SETIT